MELIQLLDKKTASLTGKSILSAPFGCQIKPTLRVTHLQQLLLPIPELLQIPESLARAATEYFLVLEAPDQVTEGRVNLA